MLHPFAGLVTENPVCVALWRRSEINCRAVDTSNIAVLPSARIIVDVVSSSSLRESLTSMWSPFPVRPPWVVAISEAIG
jgi:hypothetical protein